MRKFKLGSLGFISINFETASIGSIVLKDFEVIKGRVPFFSVRLRHHDDSIMIIKGDEFKFIKSSGDSSFYFHKLVDVVIDIKNKDDSLIFKISIQNKSDFLIEQVEIMSFGVNQRLEDEENGIGSIIVPYNEGVRVSDMKKRENSPFKYSDINYPSKGINFVFPNMICSQFMAYCLSDCGIFLGMLDKNRTPKHIDFKYDENCIKLQMRVFANVNYGENYEMDFPCFLTFFEGNYFDAFEIYRTWFENNLPTGLEKIKDRYNEFPKWYHEYPLVVTYPICGTKDSDLEMKPGKLYPYTNALPVLKHFIEKCDSKVMALLMQWESTAPWAPPYSWPPYGDIVDFNNFVNSLHNSGNYIGLYTSGFGWTNISFRREYNKEKEFIDLGIDKCVCESSNREQKSTIVANIRKGFDLCPSQEKAKQLIVSETQKLIDANIDYVQVLDQNHGGCSYFCYSDRHGHIPAPGKWQIIETDELLSRIDIKNSLLGCESGTSEPFLKQLAFSDNRYILNQYFGEAIPLYSYIYHEYINNFMGNGICNLIQNHDYSMTFRMAYSFLCGDFLTFVIDDNGKLHASWCIDKLVDEQIPLRFAKTLIRLRNLSYIGDFLHMGRMIKPLEYKCNFLEFNELYDYKFSFPCVLTAAYEFNGERIQIFINYSLSKETILLENDAEIIDIFSKKLRKNLKAIEIDSLSYVIIKR